MLETCLPTPPHTHPHTHIHTRTHHPTPRHPPPCSGGTNEQIKYLVSQGAIKPLCDLLSCSDARIVTVALEGLENILKVGQRARGASVAHWHWSQP